MRFIPGPDLPSGGKIIGLDGIREAYQTGKGIVPDPGHRPGGAGAPPAQGHRDHRAALPGRPGAGDRADQEPGQRRGELQGVADIKDLSDRTNGLRLVIEVKNGFNPDALLEQLYRLTKLEDSFAVNAVALVEGQPRTLTLRDLLTIYLEHRYEVTRRRTAFARDQGRASGCTWSRGCWSPCSTSTT